MSPSCDAPAWAVQARSLARIARQLGYPRLAQRIAERPDTTLAHGLARQLAAAASGAAHAPHGSGPCRRLGRFGGRTIMLTTVPDGARHRIVSASLAADAREDAEGMFDDLIT